MISNIILTGITLLAILLPKYEKRLHYYTKMLSSAHGWKDWYPEEIRENGFLIDEFSLCKRLFLYICFSTIILFFLFFFFLPYPIIPTTCYNPPSSTLIAIQWSLSCFEWVSKGIHILELYLSRKQLFVFVFSSYTASNRQI